MIALIGRMPGETMSDLNLGPAQTGSPVKSILIAVVVLAAIAAGIYYLNPRSTANITVPATQLYAAHTTSNDTASGEMHIVGQLAESENDLYVIATLNVHNNLPIPIFLDSVTATYTTPQDTVIDTRAPSAADLARLEQIFPALTPLLPTPFPLSDAVAAKSTVQGTVLLHFPGLTEQTWKQRKSTTLTVNFTHQAPQTVNLP
jgi:hypothetical protein